MIRFISRIPSLKAVIDPGHTSFDMQTGTMSHKSPPIFATFVRGVHVAKNERDAHAILKRLQKAVESGGQRSFEVHPEDKEQARIIMEKFDKEPQASDPSELEAKLQRLEAENAALRSNLEIAQTKRVGRPKKEIIPTP